MLSKKLSGESHNVFFDPSNTPNGNITFGHIVFHPGERRPQEGVTAHADDEYSFVISGEAQCEVCGEMCVSSAGEAMFIPAGASHYTHNTSDKPFEVIYALVKQPG